MRAWRTLPVMFTASVLAYIPLAFPMQESGEYLTSKEIEQMKEAQRIDLRVKVLMKIAERRLQALEQTATSPSKKKEEEAWGPLPKGTPEELLQHYIKAIDETILNIEDAHSQDPENEFLHSALKAFREATDRYLLRLKALKDGLKSPEAQETLDRAIEATELANADAREGEARFAKPKKK
ncbi:MAG: hypothetical protein N0A16_05470 [Blastocatellia bacterium]|nr:hypothetical protein [Blastocatellia bacterium]MCS7157158.1 hypothetical protein [Blastocatellia bacterium]MCX7752379.1 hypothetical protein [Blastocatellia bacterium]MDW8167260.1 hypothetical protein [Acidobacteriota bacterium]